MKVVVTGGGTMGHITPLLMIIKELKKRGVESIHYIGNRNKPEKTVAEKHNIPFHSIRCKGTEGFRKLKNKLEFGIKNSLGLLDSLKILTKLKPDVVIASGGYVTAPVLAAARILMIPYFIHEQNRVVGKVNRLFFNQAKKVFGTFEGTQQIPSKKNWVIVGNPTKPMKVSGTGNHIVFLGGSGGSEEINQMALQFAEENLDRTIIVQTGRDREEPIKRIVEEKHMLNIETIGFANMEELYEKASIVVCRGGSTTLSELMECSIPMLVLPFKQSADNHQYENAKYIEEQGFGKIIQDYDSLKKGIEWMDKEKIVLKENMHTVRKPQPEKVIVDIIFKDLEYYN